ncbi:MFS transporter [Lacibacter luteus]|uniref:MFS transporter n=2 Tax=Lacibacter luteus TaxID=2508719 RepID=A0A4Q1CG09_9BACT|nr:MFS transporter [Lacibacter luteus]
MTKYYLDSLVCRPILFMQKKRSAKSTKEVIVFTSCSMILTALGIDIMLPALGAIRHHFGLPENSTATANLISYFFMGQITQLFFGYLTDRYGRLPVLRLGFVIYIFCGIATVFAPALSIMLLLRFFSGMGAAAVLMTAIASVRDQYAGSEMARVMSFVLTIMLLTPVIAPALGSFVLQHSSWQVVFLIPPLFAIPVFVWSFRLAETLPAEARLKTGFIKSFPQLWYVLTNRAFMRYCITATIIFSILTAYVSSSERIIGELYLQPAMFPWIFGIIGAVMAVFALSNSYFTKRFGAKKVLRFFLSAYLLVSLLFVALHFIIGNPLPLWYFVACIGLLMSFTVAADPNSSALALEPMGSKAGIAASVYGTLFFFIGSLIGTIINHFMIANVLPLAVAALIVSIVGMILTSGKKE